MLSEGWPDPEGTEINMGDPVRLVNWAGPCIKHVVEKIGRSRFKLNHEQYAHFSEVHKTPCERCTDHPQSQYPRGYEG